MGPEHAFLQASGRARYEAATDAEALAALELLARTEGIIPALESAHAIHGGVQLAKLDAVVCLFLFVFSLVVQIDLSSLRIMFLSVCLEEETRT